MAHVSHFVVQLASRCELFVLIERGSAPVGLSEDATFVQTQAGRGRLRRYRELIQAVRAMRARGCRRFFVRISQGTALVLSLLKNRLDIEVFYWNSGTTRLAWPSWRSEPTVRARLALGDIATRILLRRVDKLVTGPESMVDYYVREYGVDPKRCIVLYNDIELGRGTREAEPSRRAKARGLLGLDDDTFAVLFVGRVSRYKGGRMLEPLADDLDETGIGSRYEMIVVGEAHLPEVANSLSERRAVRIVGAVPNEELDSYYSAADAFVLPSLSEGFPRVVLEAMAFGLPVIGFDVGGVRDVLGIRQQELIHPVGRTDLLARSLSRVAGDSRLRSALMNENLERVKRFSTAAVADMFLERIVEADV